MTSATAAFPPSCNTGGKSPLSVAIDWINFTVPSGSYLELLRELQAFLGVTQAEEVGRGIHGYASRVDVGGFGFVAFGGESQRGTVLVSINGAGCQRIANFRALRAWGESLHARITRLDICADDHAGEHLDIASGIQAWRDGRFKLSGRPPKAHLHDDLGSGDGSTLTVGSRLGGKLFRLYEKGKQLGDTLSRWCRAEVEFHNKDRIIPWQAVTEPAAFLAGAYPFLEQFSLIAERINTIKKATAITISQVRHFVKTQAGRAINALLKVEHGDIFAMVESVRRDGFPSRLNNLWQAEKRCSV